MNTASLDQANAQMALNATENSAGTGREASAEMKNQSQDRKELRREIQARQKRALELLNKLEKAQKRGGWSKFKSFFSGSDPEGDVRSKQGRNRADMDKAKQMLQLAREEAKDVLADVKEADSNVKAASSTIRSNLDEQEQMVGLMG